MTPLQQAMQRLLTPSTSEADHSIKADLAESIGLLQLAQAYRKAPFEGPPEEVHTAEHRLLVTEQEKFDADVSEGPSQLLRYARGLAVRDLEEIKRLIEVYPPKFRCWCDGLWRGGCACTGCVIHPAPSTVRGDPEGKPFPNPADRLNKEEVEIYWRAKFTGAL